MVEPRVRSILSPFLFAIASSLAIVAAASTACVRGNEDSARDDAGVAPIESVTATAPDAPVAQDPPREPLAEPPVSSAAATSSAATSSAATSSAATPSDAVTAAIGAAPKPSSAAACPDDMVLVEGAYCPDVKHTCLEWMDPPGTYENFRCATYGKPQCVSAQKTPMRFCIDRDEYTAPGEKLPAVHHSWTSAKAVCEEQGKRLCLESEWQFACEGEEMRPYPYGFVRDASACNIDRTNLGKPNSGLRDLREPAGSHPKCVSPFGVRDMSGNVEEWATLDAPKDPKDRSSMKGAWWLPGRNHCRAATTGHGETYEGPQVGVRCCADVAKP